MPAAAVTVAVPLRTAPPVPPASAADTWPVKLVAVLLNASCAVTTTGPKFVPAATVRGCVVTASFTAAPGVAVAVNVAGVPTPATVAVRICVPAVVPSVQVVCASPFASVVTVALPADPPLVAANVTTTPGDGAPLLDVTFATTGCASAAPTAAVCPEPETTATFAACNCTCTVATRS